MVTSIQEFAQDYLEIALDALAGEEAARHDALDRLPVPVYTTDPNGFVTYWNQACAEFAGREPKLGKDRWCVTWKIHTTAGDLLPHDRCPMAVAIKEGRTIRDEVAIAERPDGTRRAFRPHPTPLFDEAGRMTGAVNMLIDVSADQAEALQDQARRCERLAKSIEDSRANKILRQMADGYRRNAMALREG